MSVSKKSALSFVRAEMLEEAPPPLTEAGAVKWVRENLFSSWLNSILTVVSIAIVWWVLAHILPWMVRGIWDAGSLTECRAVRDELGYSSAACWAVIAERWPQLVFGFYPSEFYWRPLLAFALLCAAVAPILYSSIPRKFLWFSTIYPFIAYLLLWGGSVWGPVAIVACAALGYGVWVLTSEKVNAVVVLAVAVAGALAVAYGVYVIMTFLAGVLLSMGLAALQDFGSASWYGKISYALLMLICFPVGWATFVLRLFGPLAAIYGVFKGVMARQTLARLLVCIVTVIGSLIFLTGPFVETLHPLIPIGLESVDSKQIGGFMLAVVIGVSAIVLSLPLGILLALGRQSDLLIVNKISVAFIEVIRGVPLIVWLFTASLLLNYFLPPGTNFDLMLRVIIMVTLFSAAYIAEVIRGGLAALPKGQYEGADSLGLDYWQSMRLIILPQALKISIPGIVNTFIGLFKDTTLVVFIGLQDPIGFAGLIRASTDWNGIYWELFIFIGLMFFCFCFFMSRYSQYLERRLRTERH